MLLCGAPVVPWDFMFGKRKDTIITSVSTEISINITRQLNVSQRKLPEEQKDGVRGQGERVHLLYTTSTPAAAVTGCTVSYAVVSFQ